MSQPTPETVPVTRQPRRRAPRQDSCGPASQARAGGAWDGADLRTHPQWAPSRTDRTVTGWRLQSWCEPLLPDRVTLDAARMALLGPAGQTLRLVVLDGADTCPSHTPQEVTDAVRAAAKVLLSPLPPVEALHAAHAALHLPGRQPYLSNLTAAAAVVDLDLTDGAVDAARAGNIEVWAQSTAGAWRSLFTADRLTSAGRWAWDTRANPAPPTDRAGVYADHLAHLEDATVWACPPLGVFPDVRPEHLVLPKVAAVAVASDGAHLNPDRVVDLPAWLGGDLQVTPPGHPHPSPHGDVTALWAARS